LHPLGAARTANPIPSMINNVITARPDIQNLRLQSYPIMSIDQFRNRSQLHELPIVLLMAGAEVVNGSA
jgi:hypothetical protein